MVKYRPTLEEIIANAPEGATHYSYSDEDFLACYWKDNFAFMYFENVQNQCDKGEWEEVAIDFCPMEAQSEIVRIDILMEDLHND